MEKLPWTSGAVMGRVGMLDWSLDKIEALFEVLHLAVKQEEICDKDSDEADSIMFLVRVGTRECESHRKELKRLHDMASEQNSREVAEERKKE
jgi:hypothetical protein